jgi:hypothetical protein
MGSEVLRSGFGCSAHNAEPRIQNAEPAKQKTNGDEMMMRQLKLILIIPALVGILLIPAFSQEDMEVVDNEGFSKKQRPPAVFRHDEHNEKAEIEDCIECHHIYEKGEKLEDESSEDQSCADCHDEKSTDQKPGLRKAFHTNCKGCHLTRKQGPVMCGKCHVRS